MSWWRGGLRDAVHVRCGSPTAMGRSLTLATVSRPDVSPLARRRRGALALLAVLAGSAATSAPAGAAATTGGAAQVEAPPPESGATLGNTAFDRQGMWIWYVSHSEGGSVGAIVARAKRYDIGTVYVKAADGAGAW